MSDLTAACTLIHDNLMLCIADLVLNSLTLDLDEGLITFQVSGAGVEFAGTGINCEAFTIIDRRYVKLQSWNLQ